LQPKVAIQSRNYRSFVPLHPDSLHDLSSPVNQISTVFELYLMRRRNPVPGQDDSVLINLLQTSIERLQRNIQALQKCSGIAEAPCDSRVCDGSELAAAAIASLEPLIRESGARVVFHDLGAIRCDPKLMTLVFTVLIENALRFRSEAAPEVQIEVVHGPGESVYAVRDNGIGIDPRHHDTIFHVLKRVNGDRYPGAGAGLAIARRILERHGGRIWVDSSLGKGSVFFFTVPSGSA
jgi:light-regulated signal transduction histidine kinase (bacteriophytochrome)